MPVPKQAQQTTDSTDTTQPTSLSSDTMNRWNNLINFAKSKGYSGMAQLDHDPKLRQKVFDEYNKANPNATLDQSIVQPVQQEIQNIKIKSLAAMKSGSYIAGNGVTDKNFMNGISKPDNIFGSKTSSWQFPSAYITNKQTGEKKNLGFVNKTSLLATSNR